MQIKVKDTRIHKYEISESSITIHPIVRKMYTENEVRELLYSLAHTIPGTMLNVPETNNFLHMFCKEKLKK